MQPTPENRELVTAECARLTSIGYLSEEALTGYAKICLRHFAGPDAVSRAVTHFAETCATVPPAVEFVRYAAAEAAKVPTRAYCDICKGTGFDLRKEIQNTLEGSRQGEMAYYCRCRAIEGQPTAPPAETQDEPFDPGYDGMSYREQLIADGCGAIVAMLDAQPATAEGSALSRLAAASERAKVAKGRTA